MPRIADCVSHVEYKVDCRARMLPTHLRKQLETHEAVLRMQLQGGGRRAELRGMADGQRAYDPTSI